MNTSMGQNLFAVRHPDGKRSYDIQDHQIEKQIPTKLSGEQLVSRRS